MAYQRWWKTIRDQQGNAVNGASCAVYNGGTGTLATIYDANSDDSAPAGLSNPFTTTANGVFGFMAADGEYDVQISGGNGATQQYRVRLDTLGQSADSLRSDLAASSGAGLVGDQGDRAGSTARTQHSKNTDRVSVFDFMTSGQIADVRSNSAAIDVTAAIQAAIDSFPLNTANVGVLAPAGFSNGGNLYFPSGRYKVTGSINLRRGLHLVGESRESTQLVSFYSGSVLKYADAGRFIQDEIHIENMSIWQDASVSSISGAGIDCFFGPASSQSIGVIIKNVIVTNTYQGIRIGAGVWSGIENAVVFGCTSYGFNLEYDTEGIGASTSTTSTTFKNCYAFLCDSGYRIKNAAYCSFLSCASDSNTNYGYIVDGGVANSLFSCGAERNGVGGVHVLNGAAGTVINAYLLFATAGSPHGVVFTNAGNTIMLGGVISAVVASGGYGLHTVSANGYVTVIGTSFIGNFVGFEYDNKTKLLNLTPGTDSGFIGAKNHWAFNNLLTPPTSSVLEVGGEGDSATNTGFIVDVSHTASDATRNVSSASVFQSKDTAVTYPLVIGHLVKNAVKGASAAHTRCAGVYIEEQSTGTTATANVMHGPVNGTVPAGSWDTYSDSSKTSFWKSGQFQFLTTSGPIEKWGTGTPEGVVSASVGSVFHRTDGGAGTCLYIKESGTGNTGWVAK